MKNIKRYYWIALFVCLFFLVGVCGDIIWTSRNTHTFTFALLNIGQGDAIYIESPDHHNMLIDSGPDDSVIGELHKVMRWYDRHIDVLMITNPDKDHIYGFLPVMQKYKVSQMIEPGTFNTSDVYKAVERSVAEDHIPKIVALRGQVLDLGGGASLRILFPDRDVHDLTSNTGSIIAQFVYGSSSVMLTGDAPFQTEEYVADLEGSSTRSTILKEGHHGSRTAASEKFFIAVDPKYDVISAGKHNPYGHPHKETIDLLNKLHIPILGTYKDGTIVFTCNEQTCKRESI